MVTTGNSFNCFHPKWNSTRSMLTIAQNDVFKKIKVTHRKCAFDECSRDIPYGKHAIYCSTKCRTKARHKRIIQTSGKKLVWRGIRRAGL
jgi:hypothetical protein